MEDEQMVRIERSRPLPLLSLERAVNPMLLLLQQLVDPESDERERERGTERERERERKRGKERE
jgi:hypothetical protein